MNQTDPTHAELTAGKGGRATISASYLGYTYTATVIVKPSPAPGSFSQAVADLSAPDFSEVLKRLQDIM